MNKANIFISASWLGLSGLLLSLVGLGSSTLSGVGIGGAIFACLAAIVMLWARRADEYTQALWTAGASVAFGAMVLTFLALPFLEGLYDGFTDTKGGPDIPTEVVPLLAVHCFYIGVFMKRLRGDV
ncbi:MAG: hypothetical protein AAF251_01730 [Pseudomonadota bacterium]